MIGELDLTMLRAFVTLAEHLHFGRAAEAWYVTQLGSSTYPAPLAGVEFCR